MKPKKILGLIIASSIALQCVPVSVRAADSSDGVTLIANDIDTDWQMMYNWARFEEGFGYHSTWEVEDGFRLCHDSDKHYAADAVKYLDGSIYKFKVDKETNLPVASSASSDSADTYSWYYSNRHSYLAEFVVGETEADTRPAVISFTYRTTNPATSFYGNEPATVYEIVGQYTSFENQKLAFQIFPNYSGKGLQIAYYNTATSTKTYKELGVPKDEMEHDIMVVISPELTADGRYKMEAISVDGVVTKLENVYGLTAGMSDMLINRINYKAGIRVKPSYEDEIKNLKVERGFKAMELSTDFVDGEELVDGINITATAPMVKNSLNDSISVYDCDFDDELITEPGAVITYSPDMMSATVKFTMLEAGGNYRMEITGVEDIFGGTYNDVLSVNFSTPASEDEGDGEIDDTPDSEADSSNLTVGDIAIGSSNTLYHGHNFYQASKTDGIYEIKIDKAGWFNAEQNKYSKNGYYYFTDEDGNEKQLGYGNDNWNKLDMVIGVTDSIDTTKPIAVSYEWYSENFGAVSEWSSNYMTVMGLQAFLPDSDQTKGMLKYYEDGNSKTEAITLSETADGWHSITLVISPQLSEGRCKLAATVIDGVVKFYDKAYSVLKSDYTADTFVINDITAQIAPPKAAEPAEGILKLRNVEVKRLDGLRAEVFMPLGLQNPNEPIKLNFNYALEDEVTADDFSIYEISEDADGSSKETKISNRVEVKKAYDGKQLNVTVLDGGLYYDRSYKLVIDKNIVVEDYITLSQTEYEFSTYKYPDDITAELTRAGDVVNYNISGGGDSFLIMVSTYDSSGALVGMNTLTAQKQGSGNREKARGNINISNADKGEKVLVYIFTADGSMKLYRLPTEL